MSLINSALIINYNTQSIERKLKDSCCLYGGFLYWGKNISANKRDLTLWDISIEKSKSIVLKINHPNLMGRFFPYKYFVPLCRDVFSYKAHEYFFRNWKKAFDVKHNESWGQINEL